MHFNVFDKDEFNELIDVNTNAKSFAILTMY